MNLSLSAAARQVGCSKSTINRAIKSGRVSAQRQDDGSYLIDAAELARVFPPAVPAPAQSVDAGPPADPRGTELAVALAQLELTRELLERERQATADLRHALALLPPPQAPQPPRPQWARPWWLRVRGR